MCYLGGVCHLKGPLGQPDWEARGNDSWGSVFSALFLCWFSWECVHVSCPADAEELTGQGRWSWGQITEAEQ